MALPKRTNLHAQENLYRPVLEFRSAAILLFAGTYTLFYGYSADGMNIAPIVLLITGLIFLLAIYRIISAIPYFRAHWRIFQREFQFVALEELRDINHCELFSDERKYRALEAKAQAKNKSLPGRKTYLCDGYEWGPEHAERAYQVNNLSSNKQEIALPFPLRPITRHFDALARKMGGNNAIFGVDTRLPLFVTEDNWFGHTLITGNVGTGKTVLLRLLSSSMLHLGHVVVVIDPKNDADWQKGLKKECEDLGIPFYHFHPGQPSLSVAIDVCHNYVNDTDLTSRLMSLISTPGESDPFVRYGEALVSSIIMGTRLSGEKPSIRSIYRNMSSQAALVNIAIKAMESVYAKVYGAKEWINKVKYEPTVSVVDRFNCLKEWYDIHFLNYPNEERIYGLTTIEELNKYATWDPSHFAKMTASIMPLFKRLTESPLDDLLSPSETAKNNIKVINSEGMFNSGGVLYISLDGLSDPESARAISQLVTSDLTACAGRRYNAVDDNMSKHSRISFFIDESHSAINTSMINLLAQGRAAKIALFVCTQTISDFIAAANVETANRITGLCNNFISLRVNDLPTQTLVIDNFGKSAINTNQVTYTTGTGTNVPHNNFSGSISERKSTSLEESIPKELLGQVPNLHIVARLQDGRKIVGQIPISVPESEMLPDTTLMEMLFKPVSKVTLRRNIDVKKVETHKRRAT
ncbi:conjugative transfer system coupling protein TraD [Photorhabdus heterorhabditis]|uniref:conjugative transfer system coupling protein TraD n=1 Tax=Photorhabdus heterorhabditis TaxID=880156 RepID=UPI0015627063|nr:conjugative transfer system coupling protein TraD [Photorhabdus heterorhabditis]NRN29014.1 conjugative transfer system coupling protein TraD [Photorhabdus heterorhabditis subsp. aluminescens]